MAPAAGSHRVFCTWRDLALALVVGVRLLHVVVVARPRRATGSAPARRRSSTGCRRPCTWSTSARRVSVPGANHRAGVPRGACASRTCVLGDLEWQQALRADGRLDLLVVHQRRRPAEFAVLADPRRVVDHHRLAALALHAAPLGLPAPLLGREVAQRRDQVDLPDLARVPVSLVRRLRSRRTGTRGAALPGSTRPARRTRHTVVSRARRSRS